MQTLVSSGILDPYGKRYRLCVCGRGGGKVCCGEYHGGIVCHMSATSSCRTNTGGTGDCCYDNFVELLCGASCAPDNLRYIDQAIVSDPDNVQIYITAVRLQWWSLLCC